MSDLTFDPVEHQYFLKGLPIPSVSEIIRPLVDYSAVPERQLELARDRGTAVHLACHLDDEGRLDEASVDADHVLPRLNAWRAFKREARVDVIVSETPMHSGLGFAGTPDRFVEMDWQGRRCFAVIDIKTTAKLMPAVGVQLAGYHRLLSEFTGESPQRCFAVRLAATGEHQVREYPLELPTFLSLLNVWNWRARHG